MHILMFSRGMGVGAGRGRDFDIFELSLFKNHFPETCIVKIYQNCHAFIVVRLFYCFYTICIFFCRQLLLWCYSITPSMV